MQATLRVKFQVIAFGEVNLIYLGRDFMARNLWRRWFLGLRVGEKDLNDYKKRKKGKSANDTTTNKNPEGFPYTHCKLPMPNF